MESTYEKILARAQKRLAEETKGNTTQKVSEESDLQEEQAYSAVHQKILDRIANRNPETGVYEPPHDPTKSESAQPFLSGGETQRGSRVGDTAVQVVPGKTVSEANKQVNATVRSASDIAKDLRAVNSQIEKLNVNTTRNTSWVPANVQTEEQKQKLNSLKTMRERLQQEYNAATRLPDASEVSVPQNYTRNMPVTMPEGMRRAEYWASIPDYTDLTANLSELESKKQELTDFLDRSTRDLRVEKQKLLSQKGSSAEKRSRIDEIDAKLKEAEEKAGISAINQQIAELESILPASYAKLQRSADFEQNGVFDEGFANFSKDALYNLVNKPNEENDLLRNTYTQGNVKASEGVKAFSDIVTGTAFNDPTFIRNMTDEERKTYNYIYKKSGKEAADKYLTTIESGLTARYREQIEEQSKKFAKEHPVAASALTVAASPLKAVGYVGQVADYAASGKIDQNSPRNAAAYSSTAVRGEVAENIDESITRKVGEVWGNVGSNAYQIGMSMADFAFNTLASGGTAPLASFIMGSSAAADTTIRAKDRGLKDNQAFALGFISGATELLTEKYSIDTLLEKSGMGKKAFTYWLKNVIGEGSEETTSEFVNIVADIMIAGDKSEWNQSIETYKKNGMSEQDAFWATFADNAINLGVSFIGGAVSGGTLAALKLGGDVIDRKVTHSSGQVHREIYDADTANKTEKLSAVNAALETAKSAKIDDPAEMTKTSAEFVRTVRDARPDTKNAINTAIDYVREEISVYNDLIEDTKDSKQKSEYIVERAALINVDKTLRSNRAEVDAILANLPAQTEAQTEPGVQAQTETVTETEDTNRTVGETEAVVGETASAVGVTNLETETAPAPGTSETSAQPVSVAETEAEQTAETSTNSSETPPMASTESSTANFDDTNRRIAIEFGFTEDFSTPEEAAEHLSRSNYKFEELRENIKEYRKENTAESNAVAERLTEIYRVLAGKNRPNIQKIANAYVPSLRRFGISKVVVEDMPIDQNGYFDRKDNSVHLSTGLDGEKAVGRLIVHEFTHNGAKIDMSLVNGIVSAMESRKGGRGYVSEAVIREAYADQLSGLTAEEADSIVREERAALFMERIMEDVNVLDEFRDDRTFLRKILDAIRDFFARNDPDKQEQIRLRNIEKKINDLLKAANVDAKVKTDGRSETNVGGGDIRMSRDIESDITAEDVETLRTIPRKSVNEFTSEEIQKTEPWARKFYKELGTKSPFFRAWFGDWRSSDPTEIDITEVSELPETLDLSSAVERGSFSNADTNWNITVGSLGINDTVSHARGENISPKMLTEIRGIIGNAVLLDTEISEKSSKKKHIQTAFMHKLYAPVNYNGKSYIAKVSVEEYGADGNEGRRFYNLKAIKMSPAAGGFDSTGAYSGDTISISDLFSFVKRYDSEFHPKESSEVVNNDGAPKVVYHGTPSGGFNVFDKTKIGSNTLDVVSDLGFYFTNDPYIAKGYQNRKSSGETKAVYLDIKNPLIVEDTGWGDAVSQTDNRHKDLARWAKEGGHDGIIVRSMDEEIEVDEHDEIDTVYVVFDSNQIKSATDNIGTFDPDNPDIRYSRDIETPEQRTIRRQQEQIDYLKRQFTSQTALGWAKDVNISQRETFAADIAGELPGVTVDEVSVALKSVWDIQARPKRGSLDTFEKRFEEVQAAALEAARRLVDSAARRELNPAYEQYNDLRNYLRTTPIKLNISKEDMGGDSAYSEWRKRNLGLLRISDDPSARGIDSVYKEISEQYPEFFPDDITDMSEMLRRLGDVAVNLRGFAGSQYTKENPFAENREEYVNDVAARILLGFDELARPTLAAEREQADKKYREYVREFGKQTTQFRKEIQRLNRRVDVLERRIAGRDEAAALIVERRKFRRTLGKIHEEVVRPTRKKHVNQSVINTIAALLKEFDGTKLTETKTVDSAVLDKILMGLKASDPQTTKFAEAKKDKNGNITDDGVLHDEVLEMMQKQVEALKMAELALDNTRAADHPKRDDVRRLSLEYYRAANDLLKMMNGYINHANQMFVDGKIMETHEFIQAAKDELLMKRNARYDAGGNNIGAVTIRGMRDLAEKLKYESVSPAQFFSMWGETGQAIMRMFRVGQNTEMRRMEQFADFMRETVGKEYAIYAVEGSGKGNLIRAEIGDKFVDVSKAQLMSLYCLWQRPAARSHLEAKGASFLNVEGKQKSDRTFPITQEVFDSLMKHLSAKDIQVAQAIQKFLSRECSSWGNEASLRMYGYEMYGEEFYFPIRVNDDVKLAKEKNWGTVAGDLNLEFSSFTNSVTPHSTSAIVIDNIFDVAENHVSRMAAYSAYAPVCRDFQQALKYGEMRDAITKGMGDEGLKYLYDFLKRVNGNDPNRRTRSATYSWLASIGNMSKRAAVSANISTIEKQKTSALRAMAMISPKYVLGAKTGVLIKSNKKNNLYGQTYRRMIEGSGAAKMKMLGYSDTGFGHTLREQWDDGFVKDGGFTRNVLTSAKATRAALKGYDRLTEFGMLGAAKADEAIWVAIYRACELEAKDKYKGKGLSAEQVAEKVNERFNDIIGETQVVDTVLDSAPFAERALGTGYGHFMNEPVKTFGQLLTAVEGVRDGRKGAKAQLAKVSAFIAVSNLVAEPVISALFSMLRDDEDDTDQALRKFLKQYTGIDLTDTAKTGEGTTLVSFLSSELMDGLFGVIPILGNITEILFDALQGFDSGRMETEALQNLVDTTKDLFFTKEDEEGKKSMETTFKKTLDWIGAIGTVTGLPFKTLIRDLSIVPKLLMNLTDNYVAQWEYQKRFYNLGNSNARSNKQFYNILANAYQANDIEAYQYMLNDLKNTQTGKKTFGVPWNKMKKYIEDRGGEYEIGSDLWLVSIQAEFNLPSFNPSMKVESSIAKIYKNALAEKVKNPGRALPSTPALYSYNKVDEDGNDVLDENGDPVKVEMTLAEYEDFIADVGRLSYNILLALQGQGQFKNLSAEEQVYCLDKAYDFAARYYRSKFNPDYNLSSGGKWMAEVAKGNLDTTKISRAILKAERNRD